MKKTTLGILSAIAIIIILGITITLIKQSKVDCRPGKINCQIQLGKVIQVSYLPKSEGYGVNYEPEKTVIMCEKDTVALNWINHIDIGARAYVSVDKCGEKMVIYR